MTQNPTPYRGFFVELAWDGLYSNSGENGSGIVDYSVDIEPAGMRAARITRVANFRFIWGVLMKVGTESVVCLKLCRA
jgi:hypothetical protein